MTARTTLLQNRKWQTKIGHFLLHIVMIVLGITFFMPLAWVISTSLKLPGAVFITPIEWIPTEPRWLNYFEVFDRLSFHLFIRNSFFVSIMGTIGMVLSSLTVAFGLSRLRWPGRNFVFAVLLATMMLPAVVTMIPVFIIFKEIG